MVETPKKRGSITVQCVCCLKDYVKSLSEYNRNTKLGRNSFCSRVCGGKFNFNIGEKRGTTLGVSRSTSDTPYLYYLRNSKKRCKEFTLKIEDLKYIWEKQQGICPYSGVQLKLRTYLTKVDNLMTTASLDRIDSSLGYVVGNIQFVSISINFMKHTMSHQDTLKLCELISKNYNSINNPLN